MALTLSPVAAHRWPPPQPTGLEVGFDQGGLSIQNTPPFEHGQWSIGWFTPADA